MKLIKHVANGRPDIKFWAQRNPGKVESYSVIYQADGFPATEDEDDWFADFSVADAIAKDHAARYNER